MSFRDFFLSGIFFLVFLSLLFLLDPHAHAAESYEAVVVTPDMRASEAALKVLEDGGNAADALVTAQAVLNVVAPQSSGIAGGASLLYYDIASHRVLYFDGTVKSPEKMTREIFFQTGQSPMSYSELRKSGVVAGVPGVLRLLGEIQSRYGSRKLSFAELLAPAVELAGKGTEISGSLSDALKKNMNVLALNPYFRDVFFYRGSLLKAGDKVKQPDLANTLRLLQKEGPDAFYKGKLAEAFLYTISNIPLLPGKMTNADLKHYELLKEDALYTSYHGYDLFTASPPSAGGVMFLEACNVLEALGLASYAGKPESVHLVDSVMKLIDRTDKQIGDPEVFELPLRSRLSKERAQKQASGIRIDKADHFQKMQARELPDGKDPLAASILIIDRHGNIVNYSASMGDAFGNGQMVRDRKTGYGIFLNDLLLDFSLDPEDLRDPDFPNAPGPGQRPRNFFMPVTVFKSGKPVLVLNAVNGRESVLTALNIFVQRIDFENPCEGVLGTPRVFDRGGMMVLEKELYDKELWRVQWELDGHRIRAEDFLGDGQMVCFEQDSGKMIAESDLRGGEYGAAAG